MTPEAADTLRRAAAHVLVDDVDAPELADDAAHHVFRVLRTRDGELVTATDGAGRWRVCRASGGAIEADGEVRVEHRRSEPLAVAFAIPKQDRPEWIVQKLTELGIDRIALLHAERSVVKWDPDRATKHLAKLHRIAAEALQQSRGVWLPDIDGPLPAIVRLSDHHAAEPGAARSLAATVDDEPRVRRVAIGPEGGWSDAELHAAAGTVSIGVNVLRVETAAVAAAVQLAIAAS